MQQETQINVDAIKQWEITPEGYLQIDIPIARPGVLVYDRNRGDAFTAKSTAQPMNCLTRLNEYLNRQACYGVTSS